MLLDLVQLRLRQHPTIPHYHYSSQAELLAHLVHLVRDRCGISGIARIDLYCYWSPLRIGQHSVDDDRQPLLSISVVTQACQRAGATLVVAARDVVQNRAPLGKMALGQLVFDALFTFQQPVHGLVEVILVGVLHRQLLRKCGRMPLSRRGQLRAWMDQPLRDHPHHQVALAAMLRRNDGVQPKLANRAQDGSVRKRSFGETSGSSRRSRRRVSTLCLGQSERLASVRLRVFLPSRHPSRSRMAGGESRLGTISIYMGAIIHTDTFMSSTLLIFTWEHIKNRTRS